MFWTWKLIKNIGTRGVGFNAWGFESGMRPVMIPYGDQKIALLYYECINQDNVDLV